MSLSTMCDYNREIYKVSEVICAEGWYEFSYPEGAGDSTEKMITKLNELLLNKIDVNTEKIVDVKYMFRDIPFARVRKGIQVAGLTVITAVGMKLVRKV